MILICHFFLKVFFQKVNTSWKLSISKNWVCIIESRLFSLIFPKKFAIKLIFWAQLIFSLILLFLDLLSTFAEMKMFFRKKDWRNVVLRFEIFWNCLRKMENLLVQGDRVVALAIPTLRRDTRFLSIYIVLRDGWGCTGWGFMRWLVSSF